MHSTYAIDDPAYRTFYEVLGVAADCPFDALKKAYFRRAKECHPDRHPGEPGYEAAFKLLVRAFDVLSDPEQRRRYDEHLAAASGGGAAGRPAAAVGVAAAVEGAIMDSVADDILEELIVGNTVPRDTTLQTLLLDLASTERFVRFREGKTHLAQGRLHQALRLFLVSCDESPGNVLYHYYAAVTAAKLRRWGVAERHYAAGIASGQRREPPQRLQRLRNEVHALRERHRGLWGRLRNWFGGEPPVPSGTPEDEMIAATSRAMTRLLREREQRELAQAAAAKQLPPHAEPGGGVSPPPPPPAPGTAPASAPRPARPAPAPKPRTPPPAPAR